MAAKLTRVTHKIVIQLHPVADSCTIWILAPGGQSGNFWITLVHQTLSSLFTINYSASLLSSTGLTNYTEQILEQATVTHLGNIFLLCNPTFHYRVHSSRLLTPTWASWIQSTSSHPIFVKIHSNIIFITTPSPVFPMVHSLQVFRLKFCKHF
jgi:hypothetical protein